MLHNVLTNTLLCQFFYFAILLYAVLQYDYLSNMVLNVIDKTKET